MRRGIYRTLATSGIRKNRKLYLPYLLTCAGMVMMFYIISYLTVSPSVLALPGGGQMKIVLTLGMGVIGIFSLIFLFYTNSFLIRRRKKEFGLYNILGMGKGNLCRVMLWEQLIVTGITLVGGLACGILFSKLAELCMTRIMGDQASMTFLVPGETVVQTIVVYLVIFALILLNSLRQIRVTDPVELLRSEAVGEKPPKSKFFTALLGIILLSGAYYISVTITNPMDALIWFFVAVIMVIVATYLLFIAGSVTLCRLLQRKKNYYYKTNHFVSVSTMVYRMKRNGAGLASICILCTMVLVMVSATVCLFIGKEDNLKNRYPAEIQVDLRTIEEQPREMTGELIENIVEAHGLEQVNLIVYPCLNPAIYLEGENISLQEDQSVGMSAGEAQPWEFFLISLEDYNRMEGQEATLNENQVLLYTGAYTYSGTSITLENGEPLEIKERISELKIDGEASVQIMPNMYMVMSKTTIDRYLDQFLALQESGSRVVHTYYSFDLNASDQEIVNISQEIEAGLTKFQQEGDFPHFYMECRAQGKADFYALFGGLFFLGIMLGLVFILATVLIIYYKQVSEGYEDQVRFQILQKVGMTRQEIRKSINSQILTVFFLPILAAGLHTVFAFPMIKKILLMFALTNQWLLVGCCAGSYLIFALFYVLVYRVTSHSYYMIVSENKQ